jgi:hypothetical protein
MKILKKENVENWSYICNCQECNSELQIEASDLLNYKYIYTSLGLVGSQNIRDT